MHSSDPTTRRLRTGPPDTAPGPQVIQSCDCYVDVNGVMYLTDPNAGLNILQFEGSSR